LHDHLPDYGPWRAWSNFDFIDVHGRVNEVGLLMLTLRSLRRPLRWDLYIERFVAAVTLYETLTGDLPSWGAAAPIRRWSSRRQTSRRTVWTAALFLYSPMLNGPVSPLNR
jgi:hypothetical protein